MRIAFAGNPNSGKTTMYNALTGRYCDSGLQHRCADHADLQLVLPAHRGRF